MRQIAYIIAIALVIVFGCESPQDLNRPGNKMDGYITYTDTNLVLTGGYYTVSLYNANNSDPFNWPPVRTDSLKDFYIIDQHYVVMFSIDGIETGNYFVASTWSKYPKVANEIPKVLGTYGCDTTYNCTEYKPVEYPNYQGNFRNILSHTDPLKALN